MRLLLAPALALFLGLGLAYVAVMFFGVTGSGWQTGLVKILVFLFVYGFVLLAWEHRQLSELLLFLIRHISLESRKRHLGDKVVLDQ
jgi:hypothetical protein